MIGFEENGIFCLFHLWGSITGSLNFIIRENKVIDFRGKSFPLKFTDALTVDWTDGLPYKLPTNLLAFWTLSPPISKVFVPDFLSR